MDKSIRANKKSVEEEKFTNAEIEFFCFDAFRFVLSVGVCDTL